MTRYLPAMTIESLLFLFATLIVHALGAGRAIRPLNHALPMLRPGFAASSCLTYASRKIRGEPMVCKGFIALPDSIATSTA
jgi:hypothetical protein